jgi:hypothetical protein
VKTPAILTIILASVFSAFADFPTVEGLTSHLFTNAVIVWRAPTNDSPPSFWIYQRTLPRIFSETVISNAIVLGSLQSKGFPQPSTNQTCIVAEPPCPCMNVCNFFINPSDASMSFQSPNYKNGSPDGIPADAAIDAHAWAYARKLGIDTDKLVLKNFYTHFCETGDNQNAKTSAICGRGVFLSRQLDGISFFSGDEQGDGAEGFSIEFGSYGEIRSFSLCWSDVQRCKSAPTDDPQEIIHNIQSHKIIVLPDADEENYFGRLENLAHAKKVFVTKITPYYVKGVIGETPTNNTPAKLITPMAELEAIVDFGNSNAVVRMVTPISGDAF